MTEEKYLVALYSFISFGPKRINLLRDYFKSAKCVWEKDKESLRSVGLSAKVVNEFDSYRNSFNFKKYFNNLREQSIKYICIDDKRYPKNLFEIDNAPSVLYIKGKLMAKDKKAIAIVGSRRMTSYGKQVARKFAGELAQYGITIVSGLAKGIDAQVHKKALSVGGRTIAVLPCGLDKLYPPENKYLAKKIIDMNSALISEYPLSFPTQKSNFVNRNRIISGLSKATLVIEGEKKSGTLLTANHTASQGRSVFAIPGPIMSHMSGAPHFLIQIGAKLTTCVNDILEEIDF